MGDIRSIGFPRGEIFPKAKMFPQQIFFITVKNFSKFSSGTMPKIKFNRQRSKGEKQ